MEDDRPPVFDLLFKTLREQPNSTASQHAQYVIRKYMQTQTVSTLNEIISYLRETNQLEAAIISELSYVFSNKTEIIPAVHERIQTLLPILEELCRKSDKIACLNEICGFTKAIFKNNEQQLESIVNTCPILSKLTLFHLITKETSQKKDISIDQFLTEPENVIYSEFAHLRLLSQIALYQDLYSQVYLTSVNFAMERLTQLMDPILFQFFPPLLSVVIPKNELIPTVFEKSIEYAPKNLSMLSGAISLVDKNIDQIGKILPFLSSALSIIPTSIDPQSNVTKQQIDNYNTALQQIILLYKKTQPAVVTTFLITLWKSDKIESKIGSLVTLSCLVTQDIKLDYSQLVPIFSGSYDAIEAVAVEQLLLALAQRDLLPIDWKACLLSLEHIVTGSNDMMLKTVLGFCSFFTSKMIVDKIEEKELIDFILERLKNNFSCSSLHFTILSVYYKNRELPEFSDELKFYFIIQYKIHPNFLYPELKLVQKDMIQNIDANKYSQIARSNGIHFQSTLYPLCRFIIQLTPRCSPTEANLNAIFCCEVYKKTLNRSIPDLSDLFASYNEISCSATTQFMQRFISTLQKGWFIFQSNKKNPVSIKIVWETFHRLTKNHSEYLSFAIGYLPEVSDTRMCKMIINYLADVFRADYPIQELPPKCRLLEFVTSHNNKVMDDVYRCIGRLLIIPPFCQDVYLVTVANLLSSAASSSPDFIYLVECALKIVENDQHLEILISPFLKSLSSTNTSIFEIVLEKIDSCTKMMAPELMAKVIGLCIPNYEVAQRCIQIAIHIIFRNNVAKLQLNNFSLNDSVRLIAKNLNTDALFIVSECLCESPTCEAVKAFIILFDERETELLPYLQKFISSLDEKLALIIFNENETLAKAASIMAPFGVIKNALLTSSFQTKIINNIIDQIPHNLNVVQQMLNDNDVNKLIDMKSPEVLFAMTINEPDFYPTLTEENWLKFFDLASAYLEDLDEEKKLKFASIFGDEKICNEQAVSIFAPYINAKNWKSYLLCFSKCTKTFSCVLLLIKDNMKKVKFFIEHAIQNEDALPELLPSLYFVILDLMDNLDFVKKLQKQNNKKALEPLLPLLCAAALSEQNEISQIVAQIISEVREIEIKRPPLTFVSLLDLCDCMKFTELTEECKTVLKLRYNKSDSLQDLSCLIVISHCCEKNIFDIIDQKTVFEYVKALTRDATGSVEAASLTAISCFPSAVFNK